MNWYLSNGLNFESNDEFTWKKTDHSNKLYLENVKYYALPSNERQKRAEAARAFQRRSGSSAQLHLSYLLSNSFQEDDALREELAKLSTTKRHSEGTFSNDYSKYLEDRKAQDFVRWLMNTKRSGWVSEKPPCLRTKPSEGEKDSWPLLNT